jgi:hypothetical protein
VQDSLEDGDEVQFCCRNRACATVELKFVGQAGRQTNWGKLTVGKGKSLVRLIKVTVPAVKVPFAFDGSIKWTRSYGKGRRESTTRFRAHFECSTWNSRLIRRRT